MLFAAREQRPRPHRDEKIITAWNGQMISAFARAAQILDDASYAADAAQAATFLHDTMWDATTGVLLRSYCDGRVGAAGFAEDYACLTQGLLDLYETTFDVRWLQWADATADRAGPALLGRKQRGLFFVLGRGCVGAGTHEGGP